MGSDASGIPRCGEVFVSARRFLRSDHEALHARLDGPEGCRQGIDGIHSQGLDQDVGGRVVGMDDDARGMVFQRERTAAIRKVEQHAVVEGVLELVRRLKQKPRDVSDLPIAIWSAIPISIQVAIGRSLLPVVCSQRAAPRPAARPVAMQAFSR